MNFLFSYQLFIFLLALRVECSIISEEVKLLKISFCRGGRSFVDHMGRCDVQPPDEQALVCDPVEQFPGGIHDLLRGRGVAFQIDCAVGVFRYLPPVMVFYYIAVILFPTLRVSQIFDVIANRDNKLVGDKAFVNQVHREKVRHFPKDEPRFVCLIRLV